MQPGGWQLPPGREAVAGPQRMGCGGSLQGRCLTAGQREEITVGRALRGHCLPLRLRVGRSSSTVSRGPRRNAEGLRRY